ncbi:nitrite reductase small subunit NirD [Alkalihalobacillus sp. BA299]|uniref:nitrite reductase small subunit NirD n=1 Tax=Alkalihalobacillus sp. BA299 TaxID=2815938 RepID=UPI001ADA0B21|nr:nitrite reductase small subunit NirD [Alkalihalobacillus sp. BA299]
MNKTKDGTKINIGNVQEFGEKVGKEITVNGETVAVFKLSNGKFKAIENRCPHKGGPLSRGIVSGEHVFCPLHDWKVCLSSGNVEEPDEGCVKTYKVESEDDVVYIYI